MAQYIVDATKKNGSLVTMVFANLSSAKQYANSEVELGTSKCAAVFNKANQSRCLARYGVKR